jgi:hypothetical protein
MFSPNLAAFRYRDVMSERGGPIARLDVFDSTQLGSRCFQANAYLRPEHVAWQSGGHVFSEANGTGSDASPMVARFKAVSEAIERWAHMDIVSSANPDRYGFDVDASSNGMAAFPGLFRRQARQAALMEAVERFNILSWWEGRLAATERDTKWPGIRAAVLCSDAPGITVILFRQSDHGYYSYGHAAADTFEAACEKAASELERHTYVVRSFALVHAGVGALPLNAHPMERRSLFFSQPEGHELFLERLRSRPARSSACPRLVFDGAIPGAWDKYASVWRVVYEPPTQRHLTRTDNYFYW